MSVLFDELPDSLLTMLYSNGAGGRKHPALTLRSRHQPLVLLGGTERHIHGVQIWVLLEPRPRKTRGDLLPRGLGHVLDVHGSLGTTEIVQDNEDYVGIGEAGLRRTASLDGGATHAAYT